MDKVSNKKLTTSVRALAWLEANPEDSTTFSNTLKALRDAVTKALAEHERYVAGRLAVTAGVANRKKVRGAISAKYLTSANRLSARVEVTNPEAVTGITPPSGNASFEDWRAGMHTLAAEAQKHQAILASHGVPATFGADLERSLLEYDAAVTALNAGLRERSVARTTLKRVLAEAMELLRFFDGINRYRFADRPELLAAWADARNIPWEKGGSDEDGEEEVPAAPVTGAP